MGLVLLIFQAPRLTFELCKVVTRGHSKMLILSLCEHGELQGMLKRRAGNGEAFGMLT